MKIYELFHQRSGEEIKVVLKVLNVTELKSIKQAYMLNLSALQLWESKKWVDCKNI